MRPVVTVAVAVTLACAGVAAAAPVGGAHSDRQPQRVMSLNLCTDQLVLQLLPKERITSVTYLSRSAAYSYLTAEASGVAISYATAEEVLRQRPDLVVAGNNSTSALRALLKKAGVALVEVPAANNFDDIRANVRLVAHAVVEDDIGEALISQMDRTLAELDSSAPEKRIRVVGWDGSGNVPSRDTLFHAILTAAGGENVAASVTRDVVYGQYTAFDLEQLLAMRPDVIAYAAMPAGRIDFTTEQLHHRVVRKLYADRQIAYPETLYNCGLPQSADAARELRRALLAVMSKARPAP